MQQNLTIVVGLVLTQIILPLARLDVQPAPRTDSPAFVAAGTNGFTLDTGVLRGKLRADGKSRGLSTSHLINA